MRVRKAKAVGYVSSHDHIIFLIENSCKNSRSITIVSSFLFFLGWNISSIQALPIPVLDGAF